METPADLDSRQHPLTRQTKVRAEPYSFNDPDKLTQYMPKDPQDSGSEVRKPRSKTLRKQMKAREYEDDVDQDGSGSSVEDLKYLYHRKKLDPEAEADHGGKGSGNCTSDSNQQDRRSNSPDQAAEGAGMTPGPFEMDDLFDLDLTVIQATSRDLFEKRKILVGEVPQIADPVSSPQIDGVDNLTVSSHYASAAENGSDTSSEPRRINAGGEIQDPRSGVEAQPDLAPKRSTPTDLATITSNSGRSAGTLQKFFNAAMDRFLVEQQAAGVDPVDRGFIWEYAPDDIDFLAPAQAAVATAASGSTGSTMVQRVRISAILDLKKFSGKDPDEDRARAWISKIKSAFMRDQASNEEKCLTFADLLAGSAKNWHHLLSRSTRNKWSDLLRSFQIQYRVLGVSVARRYYHARRRSDESPLEYLYRLNVAGLRVQLKIKDGSTKDRREHVDHFIETRDDLDLADRLTLLRLSDEDDLEEVLRARDRTKPRQKKAAFGSGKFHQKVSMRATQIQAVDSGFDTSDRSDGSDTELDSNRRIYLAANQEVAPKEESETIMSDPGHQDPGSMTHIHPYPS
ncbi:LOW QUALITY PROTEIN: hypothetical protein PHMEG_00025691 [Phytophthora megakarya]|uniref:Retrotransposon gag domain-containing protein n=1 Tax=Phytophthora megakarya TaxID=4795 RepID=A0A225VBF7_9STRA|nr:LOW QUALITY PROTEIN: hypothetical protein PHMEG_00025691 [Phytophthora megakarya]